MTTEEKAKAYDEAIEKLRSLHDDYDTISTLIDIKEELEEIFPELAESEDERIKKNIKIALMSVEEELADFYSTHHTSQEEFLAWIEKQGEQKPYGQRKECLDCQFNYAGECKGSCSIKRNEQNPADNVEPKFHEGEWVTNGEYTWKIIGVKSLDYILQPQDGVIVDDTISYVDEQFHLWTIQDAKDGDVLATEDWVFIFEKMKSNGKPTCYCHYDIELGFRIDTNSYIATGSKIYPAAKSQRDLLFQKMKEAGYEWDAEKKELRKIEQKPVIDIDIPFGAKGSELIEASYYIPEGFHAEIEGNNVVIKKGEQNSAWSEEDKNFMYDTLSNLTELKDRYGEGYGNVGKCIKWLKSLKDKTQPQPQSKEWSEEDEEMLDGIILRCEKYGHQEQINWLKSIKQRIKGE